MSFASIHGWWRLPMKIIRELHPAACDSDPFVAFRIDLFHAEVRGEITIPRQCQSIAAQLLHLKLWMDLRSNPDFEHLDE